MISLKTSTTLLLTLVIATACTNKPDNASILQQTLAHDASPEEEAYYQSCPENPNCSAYHMVPLGEKAEIQGTLVTEEDEKSQQLLDAAIVHYENYSAQFASDQNQFLDFYVPKYVPEFATGEVLAYDDQYLYMLMSMGTFHEESGEWALDTAGTSIPYRFEYDPETLEIINFHTAGEGMERLENMFPEEVIELSYQQQVREDWEEILKARVELSDK